MSAEQELMALEKQFWTGNADFYRAHLDEHCICVFTEMAGLMSKEQVAGMIKEGTRWRDLKIEKKGLRLLGEDVAMLAYEAQATRPNGEAYTAHVSSGYIRRDNSWKMAFHQQTPLTAKEPRP
ncbi:MAG: DUF4440 domain-containing protein [Pseudomonadota bacterium]|nr:DUF4440 domain-containing protein [Pseudomonadota bacterium]